MEERGEEEGKGIKMLRDGDGRGRLREGRARLRLTREEDGEGRKEVRRTLPSRNR